MLKQLVVSRRPEPEASLPIFSQVPSVLAKVYASRGIHTLEEVGRNLAELLPDSTMLGVDAAVERLVKALEQGQHILIVGDFDCDGATSTALSILALREMGAANVSYLVPNRFEYGYGLSAEIVDEARKLAPDVIMTVDNGVSSIEGVARAKQLGIDVIVTDHHLPGASLPDAYAIVNPNQTGCGFSAKSTCGVGVVFYVLIALRRALSQKGWFAARGLATPNLGHYLDLVALGTVADVVPLEQNNRILVHQGLQRMRAGRARPGIAALLEVAGRQPQRLVASDLGFAVAPRLNAAGRLEDMSIGIECLLTEDAEQAKELAQTLDSLNHERRAIEGEMQQQAIALLDHLDVAKSDPRYGVALYDETWHQGVIGILASRIKERMHRPVVAFAPGDEGELKGSARSIPGFHIRDGLDAIASKHPSLLRKFGGHAMAAGLTIAVDDLAQFTEAFDQEAKRQLDEADLAETVLTDGALLPAEITLATAELLREAGPWGQQFPEPCFDGSFTLVQQRIVGQKHLKMVLMTQSGELFDAIAFNVDTELWPNLEITRLDIVYRLDINEFRGQRSLQLLVSHFESEGASA
ncbi:MAG: single-stranded-DNA-specific exonuclease RecJ [Pontibacterium sp.]